MSLNTFLRRADLKVKCNAVLVNGCALNVVACCAAVLYAQLVVI